ncbi:MAG: hypothetical protein ABI835_22260, partial [Chloroflexota bacterium]
MAASPFHLAALITPRPLRFIQGEHDPIFPLAGACQQFEAVQRAYRLLGTQERCSMAVHVGTHAYNHAFSRQWFDQ